MSAPDTPSIDRFRKDFETALGHVPAPDDRIALAVSGGPDSMAMLALAAAAFPGRILAATVDHGLRERNEPSFALLFSFVHSSSTEKTMTSVFHDKLGQSIKLYVQSDGMPCSQRRLARDYIEVSVIDVSEPP